MMAFQMSTQTFQIAYDGDAITDGTMDVYLLSPALLSLGELVKQANEILNGDASESSLRVKSDFKTGSFEVSLVVGHTLLEATKHLFAAHPTIDAAGLVTLLFGGVKKAPDVIEGVMKVYKTLKGEKPQGVIVDQSTHTTIVTIGSGNSYRVENKAAQLYADERILKALDKVLNPVTQEGIDYLEVRDGGKVVDRIEKVDLPSRIGAPTGVYAQTVLAEDKVSTTREVLLQVRKVNFGTGRWTFWDGSSKVGAVIEDVDFNGRVDRREEAFFAGDTLRVVMRTSQKIGKDDKLEQVHVIERVLHHTHAAQPQRLGNLDTPTERQQ